MLINDDNVTPQVGCLKSLLNIWTKIYYLLSFFSNFPKTNFSKIKHFLHLQNILIMQWVDGDRLSCKLVISPVFRLQLIPFNSLKNFSNFWEVLYKHEVNILLYKITEKEYKNIWKTLQVINCIMSVEIFWRYNCLNEFTLEIPSFLLSRSCVFILE